jgi:hypothetical protein
MDLKEFEKYFLNNKNISSFVGKTPVHRIVDNQDKLFWSFFVIINGITEFEYIKMLQKIKITEKQVKIEFLEKINKRRKEIMKKKLVKTLSSVESNLLEDTTTLETIVVLAFIEGVNILFVDERTFFYVENDEEKEINIIKNDVVVFGNTEEIKKNRLHRYRVDKVLSSISNYKLNDLKSMYNILTESSHKMTKQTLYDNIINLCSIKN